MLKTIKTTKQLRLDELLKLCWDNRITSGIYNSNKKSLVKVLDSYKVIVLGCVSATDIFEVTYEEEITEDTEFDNLYAMLEFKSVYRCDANTIKEVKELFKSSEEPELLHQIYAMVDGKLQLIYERDNHGSN